jgi:hypothetical protein
MYSHPSLRQYLQVPENSSVRERTTIFTPVAMGALIRMHAPLVDLSSMRAGTECAVPFVSCQETSSKTITAVRNSRMAVPMPDLSAEN